MLHAVSSLTMKDLFVTGDELVGFRGNVLYAPPNQRVEIKNPSRSQTAHVKFTEYDTAGKPKSSRTVKLAPGGGAKYRYKYAASWQLEKMVGRDPATQEIVEEKPIPSATDVLPADPYVVTGQRPGVMKTALTPGQMAAMAGVVILVTGVGLYLWRR